jgi:hypothetical protein
VRTACTFRIRVWGEGFGSSKCVASAQLPAGADIYEEGDLADCMYILHEGSVAEVTSAGVEHNVRVSPALLGETALLRELGDEYLFRPCALRCAFAPLSRAPVKTTFTF